MASTSNSINDDNSVDKKVDPKPVPINKYSIHEMKAAIDGQIIEFLEKNAFTEHHLFTNLKILVGSFCVLWTGVAYLYPKPFPENYYIVLFSLIMYAIGSLGYY